MNENRILELDFGYQYRAIVISDIHGGLHLYNDLINKVNLKEPDYLIILGDSIEKGKYSTEMIDLLRDLSNRERTYVLSGNWEMSLCKAILDEKYSESLLSYAKSVSNKSSIITTWLKQMNIRLEEVEEPKKIQRILLENYKEDIEFLNNLPYAIETNDHILVHAGIDNSIDWKNSDVEHLLTYKSFYEACHNEQKPIVVGHWPTSNYRKNSINSDIIIDLEKNIICIDGGYSIKASGQLNALIINKKNSKVSYNCVSTNEFQEYIVEKNTKPKKAKVGKIDWQSGSLEIINTFEEFSLCKVIDTEEEVLVKNELLSITDKEAVCIDDYVSRFLDVSAGEIVEVVNIYGKYAQARYKDKFGWILKENIRKHESIK